MTLLKKITISVVIAIISATLLFYCILYMLGHILFKEEFASQKRLLCETDYKLLLQVCRELPKSIKSPQGIERSSYYFSSAEDILQDPNIEMSSTSRNVIKTLKPTHVTIGDDGFIILSMGHTFWNFGISAYSEDYKGRIPESGFGDRELIPGLWYFDEKYKNNPNYSKKIDKLIKKNKYLGFY